MNTQIMAGQGKNRQEFDFYPTPEIATNGLLLNEPFFGSIWECASGEGHIAKILERVYPDVEIFSSDIRKDNSIYGMGGFDFLSPITSFPEFCPVDNIITNPPYKYTTEFILRAKQVTKKKIAFLLKLAALGGADRYKKVWTDREFPLKKIIVFVKRLDFLGLGGAAIEYAWFIWDREYKGEPTITWFNNVSQIKDDGFQMRLF
jgi:hypothetical protein